MMESLEWYKAADLDELPDGRVKTVVIGNKSLALTHYDGQYGALDNHCPHQGGPLGEGSIENGLLRCPWHGWDYCPLTGKPPGEFADEDDGVPVYQTEVRDDGVYVGLPCEKPTSPTVSDVMIETMVNWGVDTVFGIVGHSNLGLADAMRRMEEAGKLQFFGVRHEGAAAFAASAYAKLTGRPAACFAIAGPGATNLITGMYDAKVDRAPLLALCGQVNSQVLGPGAFQEVDLAGAMNDVSRWTQTVLANSRHAELMNLALKHAMVERHPTCLIFPDESQELPAPAGTAAGSPQGRVGPATITPPAESIDQALALIQKAKRPVIIAGHGARFQRADLIRFAERLKSPILTTFKAKGLVSDHHPLGAGVLGRSGTPVASWLMNEADLLLVFGASFSNHTGITPKIPTIHVDTDRMTLGKFHAVDVPVWGDIGMTILALESRLGDACACEDQTADVAERWRIWRAEKKSRTRDDLGKGVNSSIVFEELSRATPEDAVIAVDVGNNTYSFGRYFECTGSQDVLMSGYLGSIGFGYPAAMGAWSATRGARPIVCITGDGGFAQYMGELTTAVKHGMPIRHILLNNHELGKISKEQRAGELPVWQTTLRNPNFADYATNCGALGLRVESADQLSSALEQAFAHDGPSLVEIMTDVELV